MRKNLQKGFPLTPTSHNIILDFYFFVIRHHRHHYCHSSGVFGFFFFFLFSWTVEMYYFRSWTISSLVFDFYCFFKTSETIPPTLLSSSSSSVILPHSLKFSHLPSYYCAAKAFAFYDFILCHADCFCKQFLLFASRFWFFCVSIATFSTFVLGFFFFYLPSFSNFFSAEGIFSKILVFNY